MDTDSVYPSMFIPTGRSLPPSTVSSRGNPHRFLACEAVDAPLYDKSAYVALDEDVGFFCTSSLSQASEEMTLEHSFNGPSPIEQATASFSPTANAISQLSSSSLSTKAPVDLTQLSYFSMATKAASPRTTELRLWHYFSSSACHYAISGSCSTTAALWLYDIPNLAMTSSEPYLLDAILSVTAAHMQIHFPEDTGIAAARRVYADGALRQHTNTIYHENFIRDNAEASFFTTSLMTISLMAAQACEKFTKGAKNYQRKNPYQSNNGSDIAGASDEYVLPLRWLQRFQDVQYIVSQSQNQIFNSPTIKKIVLNATQFKQVPSLTTTISVGPLTQSFFGHLLEDLGDECQATSKSNQAYKQAVSILNYIHAHPIPLAAMLFPVTISTHFLHLLTEKQPRALAILACFFALMKRAEPIWWLHNGGVKDEIMGIVNLFEPGSKWWRHLEWPIRIALQDGGQISPAIWGSECCGRLQTGDGLVETLVFYFEALVSVLIA
ncbi:hypothetical protein NLG97_g3429 [Lecanicillium saksenae]|uniref:Uncharacterized protein n=1 Tax=Lecanicillium saksenae TaxID=468837 RepID=A0ACC1QZX1_9HYPO|nr:hypothetical protein NLG97_g3429 [Lecanicillium saksenae]